MVKVFSVIILLFFIFTAEASAQIIINEISSASDPEWVELVNSGSSDYDLNGCTLYLDDNHGTQSISFGSDVVGTGGIKVIEQGNLGWTTNWLNNSGDEVSIECSGSSDTVSYGSQGGSVVDAPDNTSTAARIPSTSDWSICSPTKNGINTTCVSDTPTPTNTPAPTSAPSATLRVKEVKNEGGEILSNVKIYIDSVYTHHYAPEDINFCESCKCDGCDSEIDLKFGSYVVKLEKDGYADWSETKDIQAGNTVDIDVVMSTQATSTNTPTVTKKPTSTPTKKTDVNAAKTTPFPPVARESNINEASVGDEDMVLGINEEINIEDLKDKEGVITKGKIPITAGVFIAGGLVLVVGASYPTIKTKLLEWGEGGNKNEPTINT